MISKLADAVGRAPADGNRLLRAVFGATFFVRFGFGLTIPVFATYIIGRPVGLTQDQVGLVGTVLALAPVGEFSTVLVSGVLSDRRGRFPVLAGGMILAVAALLAVSLTRDPLALGGANLLFGVASGAILAASLAVVADRAERARRGLEMGRFDAMNLFGWVAGIATGFALLGAAPPASLAWVFRGAAAALAAGLVFAYLLFRGHREDGTRHLFRPTDIRAAVLRRDVLLVTLPWLVIYVLLGTLFAFLGSASKGVGIPTDWLAVGIGAGGFVLVLTQPRFGRLADRWGRYRMMLVGTVGFVGILVGAGLIAARGAQLYALAVLGASAPAALAYGPAALAALADVSRQLSRGTTMAVYSLVISAGMVIGLFGSANLYARFGTPGIESFFAAVGVALAGLTAIRGRDLRTGRAREGPEAVREDSDTGDGAPERSDTGGTGTTIPAR